MNAFFSLLSLARFISLQFLQMQFQVLFCAVAPPHACVSHKNNIIFHYFFSCAVVPPRVLAMKYFFTLLDSLITLDVNEIGNKLQHSKGMGCYQSGCAVCCASTTTFFRDK
jgi:hypothetical protein